MISLNGVRVLVVDDESFMRVTLRRMLRVLGDAVVEEASDGETALAAVGSFRPQVVVCDVGMRPMPGLQFVEHLRKNSDAELAATPVVMLSGSSDQDTIRGALKLGISGYVLKPLSVKDLAARLQIALEKPVQH